MYREKRLILQSYTENSDDHLFLLSSVQSISRISWVSLLQPGRQESEKLSARSGLERCTRAFYFQTLNLQPAKVTSQP